MTYQNISSSFFSMLQVASASLWVEHLVPFYWLSAGSFWLQVPMKTDKRWHGKSLFYGQKVFTHIYKSEKRYTIVKKVTKPADISSHGHRCMFTAHSQFPPILLNNHPKATFRHNMIHLEVVFISSFHSRNIALHNLELFEMVFSLDWPNPQNMWTSTLDIFTIVWNKNQNFLVGFKFNFTDSNKVFFEGAPQ